MASKSNQSESKCARFGTRLKTAILTVMLFGFAGWCGVGVLAERSAVASQAETAHESWRTEFDNICAKTEDAMTLSEEELADLIRRCDALQPQIQKLDESRRKVYLERLRKCRGLYAYVLDAKKKEKK
jgi:hypothetical protein